MMPDFDGALCRQFNAEFWFPTTGENWGADAAEVCRHCPAARECWDYALHSQVVGVWAATTWNDRHDIRKQLGITATPILLPDTEPIRRTA